MSTPKRWDGGDFRAPGTTGVILVDGTGKPVYYNKEAVAVLAYPKRGRSRASLSESLPSEIRLLLPRAWTLNHSLQEAGLTSGRRRYVCRAFALNPSVRRSPDRMIVLVLEREMGKPANFSGAAEQFHLTQREQETVGLLTLGLTSKEIAMRMNISPNTVKTFFRLVMTKMGVSTRAGIVGKIARMQAVNSVS
jgi:DNA-binding CsgD family transcriptional regulator